MKVMVTTGAISRAKLQSNHHHQQTNIIFYRPDALSVAQLTVSKHWREKYHIPLTCLPQAHQLCLWPLTAPGYLGEGCHASHQPSDAPILHWKHWFSSRFNCLIKKNRWELLIITCTTERHTGMNVVYTWTPHDARSVSKTVLSWNAERVTVGCWRWRQRDVTHSNVWRQLNPTQSLQLNNHLNHRM